MLNNFSNHLYYTILAPASVNYSNSMYKIYKY